MTLEDISNYIDKKIENNEKIIKFTFYELRIKKNLSESDMYYTLSLIRTRLENMDYKVYSTGQKYFYDYKEKIVKDNEMLVAIKKIVRQKNKDYLKGEKYRWKKSYICQLEQQDY